MSEYVYCVYCGMKNAGTSNYCAKCGSKLHTFREQKTGGLEDSVINNIDSSELSIQESKIETRFTEEQINYLSSCVSRWKNLLYNADNNFLKRYPHVNKVQNVVSQSNDTVIKPVNEKNMINILYLY